MSFSLLHMLHLDTDGTFEKKGSAGGDRTHRAQEIWNLRPAGGSESVSELQSPGMSLH